MMLSLESDEMTALWPNDIITFTFYVMISNSIPNRESDKMTPLCQNDSLTFTFYVTISNSIPNWTTFVKEVFLFDV